MVRFIIEVIEIELEKKLYLHSNMVRFIIKMLGNNSFNDKRFTFQYGQIYYI